MLKENIDLISIKGAKRLGNIVIETSSPIIKDLVDLIEKHCDIVIQSLNDINNCVLPTLLVLKVILC